MGLRFVVDDKIPPPARTTIAIVQAKLGISRREAELLIHDGAVKSCGRTVAATHIRLNVGDFVEIDTTPSPTAAAPKLQSATSKFEILHEDESIVVVDKPAGMLTVPTPRQESNALSQQLLRLLTRKKTAKELFCVQRLDREVSGVLVFAKSREVAMALRSQFEARKPEREYIAIVAGRVAEDRGTFDSFLTTNAALTRYSTGAGQGERAITHYVVEERLNRATVLSVRLETGRRNQIRVHMAEAGHPVIGDTRYQRELASHPDWPLKRIALHAEHLGIEHPDSGQRVTYSAAWPREFGSFIKRGRDHRK